MAVPPLNLNLSTASSADGDVNTSFQTGSFNAASGGISPFLMIVGALAAFWIYKKL